jgi:hypothetical protein
MTKPFGRTTRNVLGIAAAAILLAIASPFGHAAAHDLTSSHPLEVLGPTPLPNQMLPAPGAGLFNRSTAAELAPTAKARPFIKRWRSARIDPAYRDRMIGATITPPTTPGGTGAPQAFAGTVDSFTLPLFDDAVVTLFKTGMRQDRLGSTIWTGRVADPEGGEATLVMRNGQLGGTVRRGKRVFVIEPSGAGAAKIVETDPDQRPHIDPLKVPSRAPPTQTSAAPPTPAAPTAQAASAPNVINILVAYTPAAATAVADIQSAISMGISYTNQVLSNSGINTQINLVGVMPVNYAENGGDSSKILNDAVDGVGDFAAVHAQRDALSADLVSVWTKFSDACGIAYELDDADVNPTAEEAQYGYNAISLSFGYGCLTDSVAHEIGHNMGAGHDRYVDDPTDLLTSRYNFGYVDIGGAFRTIMSYPDACFDVGASCAVVPYHSSPNLTYQGRPLGISDFAPNAADNVRRMNEIAPFVAQFRSGGAATRTLTVLKTGTGTVTSSPSGISCGATCSAPFVAGATVTLTATPPSGTSFTGWSGGGCSGTGTCSIVMNADTIVSASFSAPPGTHSLTITLAGSITGMVVAVPPASLFCPSNCSVNLTAGTSITLSASSNNGSTFTGWGGACSGTGTCTVTLNSDVSVTANFIPTPVTKMLQVGGQGTGSGTITSSPAGISCTGCSVPFVFGTVVTLTATPASGSVFTGWSGGSCSGTGTCTVTLYADMTVIAGFKSLSESTLTILKAGAGTGTVADAGSALLCGDICSRTYATGTQVVLHVKPGINSLFGGWSGPCSSTEPDGFGNTYCYVTLTGNTTITANFTALPPVAYRLSISGSGTGTGFVNPLTCGSLPCSLGASAGQQITLFATAARGSLFKGWSGAGCSGTLSCTVTINADTAVVAMFDLDPALSYTLSVSKTGTGAATLMTSNAGGINCGTVCSGRFVDGDAVAIWATVAPGSIVTDWSLPGCHGSAPYCVVTASADTTVTVTLTFIGTGTLSVSTTGNGAGLVTSSPTAITCGAACSSDFTIGSQVSLFASPSLGSIFAGWSGGGCSGSPSCSVILNSNTAVTAKFLNSQLTGMLSVTKTGTGTGSVSTSPSGIACGATCNASFVQGLPITLTAAPSSGSTFTGWSGGGCGGNQTCVTTLSANTTISANFAANSQTSITLGAAILPSSRSVQMGSTATLYGTIINSGPGTATYCGVAPTFAVPASFSFQTTSAATNAPTGLPNTPIDIPQGAAQSFVLAFTPTSPFGPEDVPFIFSCTNAKAAATYTGVNTLQLSASQTPVPDVVAIAGTTTNDGTLHIPGAAGSAAFVVAVANVGSGGQISAMPDTGAANLPLTLTVCQTDQSTGACLAPPSPSVSATVANSTTASFGVFATARTAVPFMPAVNRIFVRLVDSGGVTRGSTSVAVRTP